MLIYDNRYVLSNFLLRIGCEEDFTGVEECSTDLVTVCQVRTITSQRSQIFFPTEGSALHVPECAVCRSVQGFEARGSSCSSRISLLKVPTSSLIFKISRVVIPIVIPYLALYWKYYFLVMLVKEYFCPILLKYVVSDQTTKNFKKPLTQYTRYSSFFSFCCQRENICFVDKYFQASLPYWSYPRHWLDSEYRLLYKISMDYVTYQSKRFKIFG